MSPHLRAERGRLLLKAGIEEALGSSWRGFGPRLRSKWVAAVLGGGSTRCGEGSAATQKFTALLLPVPPLSTLSTAQPSTDLARKSLAPPQHQPTVAACFTPCADLGEHPPPPYPPVVPAVAGLTSPPDELLHPSISHHPPARQHLPQPIPSLTGALISPHHAPSVPLPLPPQQITSPMLVSKPPG